MALQVCPLVEATTHYPFKFIFIHPITYTGTGKTVAAEAIGFETGRPLKVINCAELVSQYVGQTGKNIEAMFKEAKAMDAILVFDDAEALFGKRNEQSNSTDRYANMDTGRITILSSDHPRVSFSFPSRSLALSYGEIPRHMCGDNKSHQQY